MVQAALPVVQIPSLVGELRPPTHMPHVVAKILKRAEYFHWRSHCLTLPSCCGLGRVVFKITPGFRIKKEKKVDLGQSLAPWHPVFSHNPCDLTSQGMKGSKMLAQLPCPLTPVSLPLTSSAYDPPRQIAIKSPAPGAPGQSPLQAFPRAEQRNFLRSSSTSQPHPGHGYLGEHR